jgi:hypothetical protein
MRLLTGPLIINFFEKCDHYQKLAVLEILDLEELSNILSMQDASMIKFLDNMMLEMKDFRNDHIRMETASLNGFPYYAVENLLQIEHPSDDEKRNMVSSLVDTSAAVADREPCLFFTIPTFLDYAPGSTESLALLDVLQEQGMSQMYTSQTIWHIILYKWSKIAWLYWLLFAVYIVYLFTIMYWKDKWQVFIAWFCFYFILEMIQLMAN